MSKNSFYRTNFQIRVPYVRVVQDGNQLGIFPIDKARKLAQEAELDLVEISPQAKPPVCGIMDFGKFKYEQKIKEKEAAKKQREQMSQLKEIRLRPITEEHDAQTKINQARGFLKEGKKVQFNLRYKGSRELVHTKQGFDTINKVIESLKDVADVENPPRLEGHTLRCRLQPKV